MRFHRVAGVYYTNKADIPSKLRRSAETVEIKTDKDSVLKLLNAQTPAVVRDNLCSGTHWNDDGRTVTCEERIAELESRLGIES
jgi:hypothetical protein